MFAGSLVKNSLRAVTRLFSPSARLMSSNCAPLFKRRPDPIARITSITRPTWPKSRNPVGFGLCNGGGGGGVRELSMFTWMVMMPVVKALSAFAGNRYGKWRRRTEHRRQWYWEQADKNRRRLYAAAALAAGLAARYLAGHVERDPVSGRSVLLLFDERELESFGDYMQQLIEIAFKDMLVRPTDRRYKRVASLTAALVTANQHVPSIRDRRWRVLVIDDADTENAFSLSNASISVFTGLTQSTDDDQLALIIGHEMAHCTLRHFNRMLSVKAVTDALHVAFIAATWARLPAPFALILSAFSYVALNVLVLLPLSRGHELEADRAGCMFAAAACFDVTQGPAMWTAMADKQRNSDNLLWFMEMHPTARKRARHLTRLLPEAQRLRELADCD